MTYPYRNYYLKNDNITHHRKVIMASVTVPPLSLNSAPIPNGLHNGIVLSPQPNVPASVVPAPLAAPVKKPAVKRPSVKTPKKETPLPPSSVMPPAIHRIRVHQVVTYDARFKQAKINHRINEHLHLETMSINRLLETKGMKRSYYASPEDQAELAQIEAKYNEWVSISNRLRTKFLHSAEGQSFFKELEAAKYKYTITNAVNETIARLLEYFVRHLSTNCFNQLLRQEKQETMMEPKHLRDAVNVRICPEIANCCLYRTFALYIEHFYNEEIEEETKRAQEKTMKRISAGVDTREAEPSDPVGDDGDDYENDTRTPEQLLSGLFRSITRDQISKDTEIVMQKRREELGEAAKTPKLLVSKNYIHVLTRALIEWTNVSVSGATIVRDMSGTGETTHPKITLRALEAAWGVRIQAEYGGNADMEYEKLRNIIEVIATRSEEYAEWRNTQSLEKKSEKSKKDGTSPLTVTQLQEQKSLSKRRSDAMRYIGEEARKSLYEQYMKANPGLTKEQLKDSVSDKAIELAEKKKAEKVLKDKAKAEEKQRKEKEKAEEKSREKLKAQSEAKAEFDKLLRELQAQKSIMLEFKLPKVLPKPDVVVAENPVTDGPIQLVNPIQVSIP